MGTPLEQAGIRGEAIAENSLVFVAFCHDEYLIRPKHAWQFADTFPLPWGCWELPSRQGGYAKESTTSGHRFHSKSVHSVGS